MTFNHQSLNAVLDFMIPADHHRGMPGGSKVRIADVLPPDVTEQTLINLAVHLESIVNSHGKELRSLAPQEFWEIINSHRQVTDSVVRELGKWLLMAYYTDPRVRDSIGVGARAPFPNGYVVHDGNLELLEQVFERGPIYRKIANDK